MLVSLPTRAYDLEMLPAAPERGAGCQGWVFGLPPGIRSEEWPLDPVSGYPLAHGFTLLLPEAYRCHGPEIVALSFFATPADHNDGGAQPDPALAAAILGEGDLPSDPELGALWRAAQTERPRLARMSDILGYAYAVMLLDEQAFAGPLCLPPPVSPAVRRTRARAPAWFTSGAGAAYDHFSGGSLQRLLGQAPEASLSWSRALAWTPRRQDPNAGKAPQEDYGEGTPSGYQSPFYFEGGILEASHYRTRDWATDHKENHIGGTMRPIQAVPAMSPYHIGFEEYLGGYNFGSGNAQLDFFEMQIDWACG